MPVPIPPPDPDDTPRDYLAKIAVWALYSLAGVAVIVAHALLLKYLGVGAVGP